VITVQNCDKKTLQKIAAGLEKAALGQSVAFVFDEGVHRIEDEGQTFAAPNGTATLRVFINGGARDTGVPEKKANDQPEADGREGAGSEPVETLHPALSSDLD